MGKIEKQNLIEDLQSVKEKIGKIPTTEEYRELGAFGRCTFARRFGSWNKALLEVFGEVNINSSQGKVEVICKNCGKKFLRDFSSVMENNYCSQNCAAIINNKLFPKRKREHNCRHCGEPIISGYTFCKKCIEKGRDTTLSKEGFFIEDKQLSFFVNKRGTHRYQPIREAAKKTMKNKPRKCLVCGYDFHVEVCHIKGIATFPLDTYISEINHPDNLVLLCPTHHWELDHGKIDINKISKCVPPATIREPTP